MRIIEVSNEEELAQELYNLSVGSVLKLGKVEFVIKGSHFEQKCYDPIHKRHRSGSTYFFCLDPDRMTLRAEARSLVKRYPCKLKVLFDR